MPPAPAARGLTMTLQTSRWLLRETQKHTHTNTAKLTQSCRLMMLMMIWVFGRPEWKLFLSRNDFHILLFHYIIIR